MRNVAGLFRDTWSDVFWESRKGPGTSDHCRGRSTPSCTDAPGDTGLSAAGLRPAMVPSFTFPTCCWKIPWSGIFRSLSVNMKVRSSVAFWLTGSSFYSVSTLRADHCPLWCHPSNPCDSATDAFFPCLPPPGGSLTLSFGFCIQECKGGTKGGRGNCKGAATSQSCCDSSSFRDWWEQWHWQINDWKGLLRLLTTKRELSLIIEDGRYCPFGFQVRLKKILYEKWASAS